MSAAESLFADPPPPPLDEVVEAARLRVLHTYRTLDPIETDRLGCVAAQAATSFDAACATITVVDTDRVWLLGSCGLPQHDYPRVSSFCDAVIRSRRPLTVPDAGSDPRFWQHTLVRERRIRAYAGVPLIDAGGYPLGAVAVMDPAARAFPAKVIDDLTALADLVAAFLAERRPTPQPAAIATSGAWLGVRTLGSRHEAPNITPGLVVLSVARASPAAQAGLRPMDILLAIDGQPLHHRDDLAAALSGRPPGTHVQLHYRRAGQPVDATIRLAPAPRGRRR